jgi:hypothetical protein
MKILKYQANICFSALDYVHGGQLIDEYFVPTAKLIFNFGGNEFHVFRSDKPREHDVNIETEIEVLDDIIYAIDDINFNQEQLRPKIEKVTKHFNINSDK